MIMNSISVMLHLGTAYCHVIEFSRHNVHSYCDSGHVMKKEGKYYRGQSLTYMSINGCRSVHFTYR